MNSHSKKIVELAYKYYILENKKNEFQKIYEKEKFSSNSLNESLYGNLNEGFFSSKLKKEDLNGIENSIENFQVLLGKLQKNFNHIEVVKNFCDSANEWLDHKESEFLELEAQIGHKIDKETKPASQVLLNLSAGIDEISKVFLGTKECAKTLKNLLDKVRKNLYTDEDKKNKSISQAIFNNPKIHFTEEKLKRIFTEKFKIISDKIKQERNSKKTFFKRMKSQFEKLPFSFNSESDAIDFVDGLLKLSYVNLVNSINGIEQITQSFENSEDKLQDSTEDIQQSMKKEPEEINNNNSDKSSEDSTNDDELIAQPYDDNGPEKNENKKIVSLEYFKEKSTIDDDFIKEEYYNKLFIPFIEPIIESKDEKNVKEFVEKNSALLNVINNILILFVNKKQTVDEVKNSKAVSVLNSIHSNNEYFLPEKEQIVKFVNDTVKTLKRLNTVVTTENKKLDKNNILVERWKKIAGLLND